MKNWEDVIQKLPQKQRTLFLLTTHTATTSKRTYIRGLVRDISQDIGVPATTFHITRTHNGTYGITDCICINETRSTPFLV